MQPDKRSPEQIRELGSSRLHLSAHNIINSISRTVSHRRGQPRQTTQSSLHQWHITRAGHTDLQSRGKLWTNIDWSVFDSTCISTQLSTSPWILRHKGGPKRITQPQHYQSNCAVLSVSCTVSSNDQQLRLIWVMSTTTDLVSTGEEEEAKFHYILVIKIPHYLQFTVLPHNTFNADTVRNNKKLSTICWQHNHSLCKYTTASVSHESQVILASTTWHK